ncbi:MAG TPA: PEP-CTERM sorting domain-containing protein [Candidatus Sulfopaludibacter sp.]|nr:PEP-CTERM sorting domain-containing protein [Candidatus Sulfopaludibacter sp.]
MHRLLTAILLTFGICRADTITIIFTNLPDVLENYNYNIPDSSGATYNGYSTATIDGIQMQQVICDDYTHDTYMPSPALVYHYSTLAGPNPLQYARFQSVQNYEAAAVLLTGLAAVANPSANTVTDYQYALWHMFSPLSAPANQTQTDLENAAMALVQADKPQALETYSHLKIYTPTAAYASNQEFLGLDTPVPTPEPASAVMLLLGLALVAAGRLGRRR